MTDTDDRHKQMADTDERYRPQMQIADTNDRYRWQIHTADTDGRCRWKIRDIDFVQMTVLPIITHFVMLLGIAA